MIQSVHCKNFQSLKDINLQLGKFTVIVGPSSSGKSAIIRALRAIADNALNSDNIMQGTKHASIAVTTDTAIVTIERSVGGSSVYKIAVNGSEESSYTKLNRQVPTQVTEALGILPSAKEVNSISFAGQHDAPYLLTESSSTAARILGELTNVSTIFAAVQKANKKAKAASTVLNIRKKDQELLVGQVSQYLDLKSQAKGISDAENLWRQIQEIQDQIRLLEQCIGSVQAASDALTEHEIIPEAPSLDLIIAEQKILSNFKKILKEAIVTSKQVADNQLLIDQYEATAIDCETNLHALLVEAGQCPLCLQEVN